MTLAYPTADTMTPTNSQTTSPFPHQRDGTNTDIMALSPANRASAPLSHLESLPFDIFLAVLAHPDLNFDYTTVLNLKNANSRFHASIVPDALCSEDAKFEFYRRVEGFAQHKDHLACFRCWRFLERSEFADSQRRGKRGKGSEDLKRQRARWCWGCGPGRETGVSGVRKAGELWYWCGQCEEW